jgi:uncharacterized protein YjbI with pentapeptide repeats
VFEIVDRYTRALLYRSEKATTAKEAVVEARESRADLSRANLSGADLSRADLSGANLSGANLSRADLSRANLSWADLSRANLSRANLSGANLSGADLSRANLSRATGINPHRTTSLLMLKDQPGKIRAYKLVASNGEGPYSRSQGYGAIEYAVGRSYELPDASQDATNLCAAGINLATLDWCMKEWGPGWRILIAEFEAADIAAIPTATDGKFRVFRCSIVGEKDLTEIGLIAPAEVAVGKDGSS